MTNPYVPSPLQRLAQRNAALAQQQQAMLAQQQPVAHSLYQAQAQQAAQQQQMVMLAQQQGTYGVASTSTFATSPSTFSISSNVPSGSIYVTGTVTTSSGTSTASTTSISPYAGIVLSDSDFSRGNDGVWHIRDGEKGEINLPDGTRIIVARDGSYKIEDKDAKIVYRANRLRDFNRFINVSDRLEEFIKFCGDEGVRRGDMLELPLKLFIGWLAIEAAKADNEDPPSVELLGPLRRQRTPRCRGCGQHLPIKLRAARIEFCSTPCFDSHIRQLTPRPVPLLLPPPDKMRPLP